MCCRWTRSKHSRPSSPACCGERWRAGRPAGVKPHRHAAQSGARPGSTQSPDANERDAAHYLDSYLKDDPDRALLHDLRFEVDGDVAQIDHLVISRGMVVYLLETKNFNGNLHINEHGEFSVQYSGERLIGIPSPLEQSRRHEGPLRKLLDRLGITGRSGAQPQFQHCVLMNPGAVIHRPAPTAFDTANVIKADQFRHWHQRFIEQQPALGVVVRSLLNIRSADTIQDFAHKLAREHRPQDPLKLPDFMRPGPTSAQPPLPVPAARPSSGASAGPASVPEPTPAALQRRNGADTPQRKLLCATCGSKISFAEGKFCWNHEARFGGLQYCREHQQAFH